MTQPSPTFIGQDRKRRCSWCSSDPLYVAYHDNEWGRPVTDDNRLYEKLCLEGFQAGLSWLTILKKREAFREAFAGLDPLIVARFTTRDVQRLMRNAGIVQHRQDPGDDLQRTRNTQSLGLRHDSLRSDLEAPAHQTTSRSSRLR